MGAQASLPPNFVTSPRDRPGKDAWAPSLLWFGRRSRDLLLNRRKPVAFHHSLSIQRALKLFTSKIRRQTAQLTNVFTYLAARCFIQFDRRIFNFGNPFLLKLIDCCRQLAAFFDRLLTASSKERLILAQQRSEIGLNSRSDRFPSLRLRGAGF